MCALKSVKISLGLPLLIILAIITLSDSSGDSFKRWNEHDKLKWADFREVSMDNSDRAALTNAGIRLSFTQSNQTSVDVHVYSVMDRSKSWVDRNKKSDYILAHEQCHFDITEYWCRKLKADLATASYTSQNLKAKIAAIRTEDFRLMADMQNDYDRETKHSEIESEQKKWEKKVAYLLKTVEDYSAESMSVRLK